MGSLVAFVVSVFVFVSFLPNGTHGSTHQPASRRSYPTFDAFQAASELRSCFSKYKEHMNQTEFVGLGMGWAGWVLDDPKLAPGVVVGPLIPKSMSTTLRQYFGDGNRPDGLMTIEAASTKLREEQKDKFWFTVVRDPLTRFVDAYVQAGNGVKAFRSEYHYCNFTAKHNPAHFCEQPVECRRDHFLNWVTAHHMDRNAHIHRIQQMYWLRNAADHLTALFRLENLSEDWAAAVAYASDPENKMTDAVPWLEAKAPGKRGRTTNVKHTRLDVGEDACEVWKKHGHKGYGAYWQILQDNALQWSTPSVVRDMCKYLMLDYACLRYALPMECQMMVGDQGEGFNPVDEHVTDSPNSNHRALRKGAN